MLDELDEQDEFIACPICGSDQDWVSCWQCLGDGGLDLYELNPTEYGPGEFEYCSECKGEGGYLECTAVPHKEAHNAPQTE